MEEGGKTEGQSGVALERFTLLLLVLKIESRGQPGRIVSGLQKSERVKG